MDFSYTSFRKTSMASILLLLVVLMPALQITGAQSVGVCYGRNGSALPAEGGVIDLYKTNGIGRMRIYEPNEATYQALKGSNIELTVTILNNNLQEARGQSSNCTHLHIRLHDFVEIEGAQSVGVCYGRNGNALPAEGEVIDLYKTNGIGRMRIYEPNEATYQALKGSNIELTVTILNNNLQALTDAAAAADWVQKNVQAYLPDVKFRYIAVGNEVHPGDAEAQYLLPAIQNIQKAIAAANLQDQIKVSTAIDTTLLGISDPPSSGAFSDAANSFINPIITFLANNGAPLLANVYPYFSYTGNPAEIDLAYALFNSTRVVVQDGSNGYQNLFDAQLDALYSALEKSGAPNMEIVVSESGWPSEGGNVATVDNAGTYYKNLINHVKNGTPKRPDRAIETYLFAMFDENLKVGEEVEKHFGIFSPNKQPRYQLTFG